MNHQTADHDLETRLASAFRGSDLPAAPGRLLDALAQVPETAVVRGRPAARSGERRRTTFGLLGIAAVLLVGGALAIGGGGLLRGPVPPSQPPPTASAAPETELVYAIQWTRATPSDPATLVRLVQVMEDRVAATRSAGVTVEAAGDDRIVVGIPDGIAVDPLRRLLGQRGDAAFVPLGSAQMETGDRIDFVTFPPLFASDGVADASIDAGQTGNRVVNFILTPTAATLFEEYTAAHVGDYFAITIDGAVLSAPVIQDAIPGGNVQISQDGTVGGYELAAATELVALLKSGPLPVNVTDISDEPPPA